MKNQYWTAKAILKDATHEWEILIFTLYPTKEKAEAGAERFATISAPAAGYNVVKTWVEPTAPRK